jgi:hypothetical protein
MAIQKRLEEATVNQHIDRQRGWVGMIVLLLALAIVAWLSKDALMKYGMVPSDPTATKAGTPGERARMGAAVDASGTTIDSAPAAPAGVLDKARGVEGMLKEQESKRSGGY